MLKDALKQAWNVLPWWWWIQYRACSSMGHCCLIILHLSQSFLYEEAKFDQRIFTHRGGFVKGGK